MTYDDTLMLTKMSELDNKRGHLQKSTTVYPANYCYYCEFFSILMYI